MEKDLIIDDILTLKKDNIFSQCFTRRFGLFHIRFAASVFSFTAGNAA